MPTVAANAMIPDPAAPAQINGALRARDSEVRVRSRPRNFKSLRGESRSVEQSQILKNLDDDVDGLLNGELRTPNPLGKR